MMGDDKTGTKGGGFFNIFDWNKKPRKRLFASVSPEGIKQGSKSDVSSADSSHQLNFANEIGGLTVVKESSNNSCSSSVTDEDGNGIRAPGVVARLMGLDSLPTTSVSDPVSTPLLEPQSFPESHYLYKSPGFDVKNPLTIGLIRMEAYARKPPELKKQKMPSSPIERFQRDALPPRSTKSLPYTYHKLASPVKNPRLISMEDAAQIMEAAAKILEPRVDTNYNTRASVLGSSSHPRMFRETKEHIEPSKTMSTSLVSSRKPAESMTVKNLKGQILDKGNSERDCCSNSPLSLSEILETNSMETKDKGKSISLAIQAKDNLQRRGNLSTSIKNSSTLKDVNGSKQQQPFRNQANSQQNKLQKKVSVPSYSGVLKQNNQKQNCSAGKAKVPSKSPVTNQQVKEGVIGRNNSNKILGCSKNGCCREGSETVHVEKEKPSSRIINLPRKEKLACKSFHSEKTEYTTTIVVDRLGKHFQPDALTNESSKWKKNSERNSMEVISFEFNSPIAKPITGNQSSIKLNDKQVKGDDDPNVRDQGKSIAEVTKHEPVTSPGLNFANGDDLSILLEQKLKELSLQLESASSSNVEDSCTTSVSTLKYLPSTYEISAAIPEEHYKDARGRLDKDNHDNESSSECSMDDGDYWIRKFQASESLKRCHNRTIARMQLHVKNPSFLSILEASFPNEVSFSSSSIRGRELYSIKKDDTFGSSLAMNFPLVDAVRELSSSASLASKLTVNESQSQNLEVEYIGEILSTAGWSSGYSCNVACGKLDPLIFHQLENNKNWSPDNKELCRLKRKVLFDCVGECLDLKRRCYFTGYRTWSKGMSLIRKSDFAEKIHKEISGWRCMENLELDEIVDKDMTSHLGRWLDFETEAFQTGIEIEGKILSRLLDEIIRDFLTSGFSSRLS